MNLLLGLFKLGALFGLADPLRVREYLGPETLMPLGSILATILGFFLVFWRLIVKTIKTVIRKFRLPEEAPPELGMAESSEEASEK